MTRRVVVTIVIIASSIMASCGGQGAAEEREVSASPESAPPADVAEVATTPAPPAPAGSVTAGEIELRARTPERIRGIYLNAYAAGSRARLAQLIALADSTEINTFVIDVKDEKGVHYPSGVPLARELTQDGEVTLRDLSALADTLHAHGIYLMARIVVFKDPILSKAKPEWSIQQPGGGLWTDKAGNTWVSAWEPAVWDHNISIAEEVAKAGFDEIQFDYVRFPEPYKSLPPQVHAKANGERTDAIVKFLETAKQRLHPLDVVVSADLFGLSPNEGSDVGIGQQWERIVAVADHVLPMVYPSHYFPTHLRGVTRPNRMPYETVFASVGMATMRNALLRDAGVTPARIIPWLQAFSAPWVDRDYDYGPEQAAAQIRAVYDVGLEDWIFWHPGSKYAHLSSAFEKTADARARPLVANADMKASMELFEGQGAKAARERVAGQ